MELNSQNYFSREAEEKYLSVSQYKSFAGCSGRRGCESRALAVIRGDWKEAEMSEALLIGSYVDAHVEGTLDVFKATHECLTARGKPYAWVEKSQEMIQRFEQDELFMGFLQGQKQVILTGELFGAQWKIKIDNLAEDFITDLKTVRSLTSSYWHPDTGRISFVEEWGYDIQGAIYPEIERLNRKASNRLPMYFAAVSKEDYPDIQVIQLDNVLIQNALCNVQKDVPRILALKKGEVEPDRCEVCDYCRATRKLRKPIMASELVTL